MKNNFLTLVFSQHLKLIDLNLNMIVLLKNDTTKI